MSPYTVCSVCLPAIQSHLLFPLHRLFLLDCKYELTFHVAWSRSLSFRSRSSILRQFTSYIFLCGPHQRT